MKKYILSLPLAMLLLCSCNSNHNHEAGHSDETEAHDTHNHDTHNHDDHEEGDEHENKSSDEIVISPEKAKAAGIIAEKILPASFNYIIKTGGRILSTQNSETSTVATISGIVSLKKALLPGTNISKGTSILSISSDNLPQGNPVTREKIAFEAASQEYDRAKELVKNKIISQKDFNSIEEKYRNARLSYNAIAKNSGRGGVAVVSPMSGYVKECFVKDGDYVNVGQPLFSVTQTKHLYLQADVSQKYFRDLQSITSANFKTTSDNRIYKLKELNGKLLSFSKSLDNGSYYIPVTFEFDNSGTVVPGSYVEVYLISKEIQNVLSVPVSAIVEEQGSNFVFIKMDEDCYRKQEVVLGMNDGNRVEIVNGLHGGEDVVVKEALQVKLASASNAIPPHSHEH